MEENENFIDSEELLMLRVDSMSFQLNQVVKQKNKVINVFYQLGLPDVAVALERRIAVCRRKFQRQVRCLSKWDYSGFVKTYQQYIDDIWNELIEAVYYFQRFREVVLNDEVEKKGKK